MTILLVSSVVPHSVTGSHDLQAMCKKTETDMATKADEPWSDKERFLIVQHVLKHADYSNLFDAVAADLVKNGCPVRKKRAVSTAAIGLDSALQPWKECK